MILVQLESHIIHLLCWKWKKSAVCQSENPVHTRVRFCVWWEQTTVLKGCIKGLWLTKRARNTFFLLNTRCVSKMWLLYLEWCQKFCCSSIDIGRGSSSRISIVSGASMWASVCWTCQGSSWFPRTDFATEWGIHFKSSLSRFKELIEKALTLRRGTIESVKLWRRKMMPLQNFCDRLCKS